MATIEAIEPIARNSTIRGGRPVIAGTTITVADVATSKVYLMQIAEEIADWYDITGREKSGPQKSEVLNLCSS